MIRRRRKIIIQYNLYLGVRKIIRFQDERRTNFYRVHLAQHTKLSHINIHISG